MTLEQALAEKLASWLAHSRKHNVSHTAIPNNVVDDMLVVLENLQTQAPLPDLTMQQMIDVGFNAFGLQLFAESVAGKTDAKTFNPFTFKFRNIKITLAPDGEVDTSHH